MLPLPPPHVHNSSAGPWTGIVPAENAPPHVLWNSTMVHRKKEKRQALFTIECSINGARQQSKRVVIPQGMHAKKFHSMHKRSGTGGSCGIRRGPKAAATKGDFVFRRNPKSVTVKCPAPDYSATGGFPERPVRIWPATERGRKDNLKTAPNAPRRKYCGRPRPDPGF